jgi:hypothetical protein
MLLKENQLRRFVASGDEDNMIIRLIRSRDTSPVDFTGLQRASAPDLCRSHLSPISREERRPRSWRRPPQLRLYEAHAPQHWRIGAFEDSAVMLRGTSGRYGDRSRRDIAHFCHTPRKENDAMSLLPTTCPECQASEGTYSTGVIHHTTSVKVIEYPVLRCGRCDSDFFALPPDNTWQRCYANALIISNVRAWHGSCAAWQ